MEFVSSLYSKFDTLRTALNLPSPGKYEELHRKAQMTFTNHFMFDGCKIDFAKGLSPNFQIHHALHLGSQQVPQTYSFNTVYATENQLLQGMVDTDGSLNGRIQFPILGDKLTAKINLGFHPATPMSPPQQMMQAEVDRQGKDYDASIKLVNPWPLDATGVLVASYLQSVTQRLALGVEAVIQRPMPGMEESAFNVAAKYTFPTFKLDALPQLNPDDLVPQQPTSPPVATATYNSQGALHVSYVHPVSAKVDLASELHVIVTPRGREGKATVAAKYEFRQSTFRTQIDSNGVVASVLEQRMGPMAFTLAGQVDHGKGESKFGFGLALETA
ncbi:eukaryotic porin/Tom40 [Catenaria anguillulae PL171]|uniref:Eukaryotic porin/Tom40 n=1 Tax=Catenaria anguillulae PL171 TaxID=765915 RepID=A0A1Y2HWE6_9FUNG|nr:eukaryotic porin/Tom40 [Catenaria anguillulae PL171]